jgi:hypothetical protein
MREKKSYLLVVDASVARAAGETVHPVSRCCREALESILRICHRIMMSSALADEWKRNESRFARRWLVSMYARRKVIKADMPSFSIRAEKAVVLNDRERAALVKDKHLIELAVDGDGIIYTLDDAIIDIWSKCCKQVNAPRTIAWKNPTNEKPE